MSTRQLLTIYGYCLLMAVAIVIAAVAITTPHIPACEEDQVLVGTGDFDHGHYSEYVCGPAVDDYVKES